ncbi:MAG: TonB-dependent receptor [Kiritimatiellae bacterium]|nr:TonB-dependent receptor [Kiritimatiellia bacterium]
MRRWIVCWSLFSGLVMFGGELRAEPDAADTAYVEMPSLEVRAEKDTAFRPAMISDATLTDTPLIELPQTVEIMPCALLDALETDDYYDSLRYISGVFTGGRSPGTRTAGQLSMRGFSGSDTMMNGFVIPKIMPIYLDAAAIEYISFFKGPMSSVYGGQNSSLGAYGAGGSVNIVTKSAKAYAITDVKLTSKLGEGQFWRASADVNRPIPVLSGAARVNASAAANQPFYLPSDLDWGQNYFVAPSLLLTPSDQLTVQADATYQWVDNPSYQGIPYVAGDFIVPYDTYYGDNDSRDKYQGLTAQFSAKLALSDAVSVKGGVGFSYIDLDRVNWAPSASAKGMTARQYFDYTRRTGCGTLSYSESEQSGNNLGGYLQAFAKAETGPVAHEAVVGLDGTRDETDMNSGSSTTKEMDLSHPVLTAPSVKKASSDSSVNRVGLLAQDQLNWRTWYLLAGVHADRYESDKNHEGDAWSPRVGLSWMLFRALALYANYSHSEAPNFGYLDEWGNEMTESWKADQLEAGVKLEVFADLWVSADVFRINQKNRPVAIPDLTNAYECDGETESKGFEFSLSGPITSNWTWWASYTYQDVDNQEPDVKVDMDPANSLALWQRYAWHDGVLKGASVSLGYRYRDSYAQTFRGEYLGDEYRIAAYHVFDAFIGYELPGWIGWEEASLQLGVQNLFDEEYVESIRHNQGFPGEPRTFTVSLKAEL